MRMVLPPGGCTLVAAETGDHGPASAGDVAYRDAPLTFRPSERFELRVGHEQLTVRTKGMMLPGELRERGNRGFFAGPRILQNVRHVENGRRLGVPGGMAPIAAEEQQPGVFDIEAHQP